MARYFSTGCYQVKVQSPDGTEWQGKCWKLEDITKISWGIHEHIGWLGGRNTKPEITWGTDSSEETLSFIDSEFIDRLWKSVGYRILKTYLNELKSGKEDHYDLFGTRGNGVVRNEGILLINTDKKFFEKNEKNVFCLWNEVNISSKYGAIWIEHIDTNKLWRAFSYTEDNIPVLNAAINIMKKHGYSRLSDVLDIL